jgi:KDO2-lipid IV(A) lauroyltransferase
VDQPDPLFYITARYRRAIEAMVRRAPDQYLWMHRYWKSRPRHERLGREIPASLVTKIEQLPWMTQEDVRRVVEWSRRDAAALAAEQAE